MKISPKAIKFFYLHRLAGLICFFVLASLIGLSIKGKGFSENIFDILPVRDSVINSHINAFKLFRQSNTIYFNVDGDNAEACADSLAQKLRKQNFVNEVIYETFSDNIDKQLACFIDVNKFSFNEKEQNNLTNKISKSAIEKRLDDVRKNFSSPTSFVQKTLFLQDAFGVLESFYPKISSIGNMFENVNKQNGKISTADSKNFLLVVECNVDSSDSKASALIVKKIEAILSELSNEFKGTNIAYAGGYRVASENARIASRDSTICLIVSLFLMCALCALAFRRKYFILLSIAPSLMGTVVAMFFVYFFYAKISAISIAFAAIAIGVSIDYAIHILYRLDSKKDISLTDAQDVSSFYLIPICTVSGTTAIAFLIMALFGGKEFGQLGVFGFVGVVFSALISVFMLPSYTVGSKKVGGKKVFCVLSDLLGGFVSSNRKSLAMMGVILSICALPFAFKISFDADISSFNTMSKQALQDSEKIRKIWNSAISHNIVLVNAPTLEEALEKNAGLENEILNEHSLGKFVKKFSSIASIFPKDYKENLQRWNKFWDSQTGILAKENLLEIAKAKGFKSEVFDTAFKNLTSQPALNKEFVEESAMARLLKNRIVFTKDKVWISTFVELENQNSAEDFAQVLSSKIPDANYIDSKFFGLRIAQTAFDWLVKFMTISFICVILYLWILLRSLAKVTAVIIPVIAGLIWCFAIMYLSGIKIDIINSMFVVFAVCVAQDYAVFMVHSGFGKIRNCSIASIIFSVATTFCAFVTLAFATHPVLRSLGAAASLSILSIFLASLMFVPILSNFIKSKGDENV